MSHARNSLALLLVLGPVALLAGCGGGGGGGGSSPPVSIQPTPSTGSIAGKVVDTTGSPVVSGVLLLDGVQQFSTAQGGGTSYASGGLTFSQGGYQLAGVPAGTVHVVKVQTTVGGVTYTGSTQVILPNTGALVGNANIVVSPVNEQATISGYVRNQAGGGVGGAQVYFQSAFTSSPTNAATASVSLIGVTYGDGHFEMDNLPVQSQSGAARAYAITASYTNSSGATINADTTLTNQTFTAGEVLAPSNGPSFTLALTSSGSGTLTPTATLLQAFTQPDIPAFYAQPGAHVAGGATVYDGIRAALSPAYAKLRASGRLAASIRRVGAAQSPSPAPSGANTVEMDLFFSLPGDQAGATDPQRSRLSGFNVFNNTSGTLQPYDFLQDPLANFYDDPDVPTLAQGQLPTYSPDVIYQFYVQSIGLDGGTVLGQSSTLSVAPLEFIALTHPADPNDTGGAVETLTAPDTIRWGGIRAAQNYFVYLYASFPGVSTPSLPQSADGTPGHQPVLSGSATSYTIPGGLVPGQQYWVVVAATAVDNPANASAISVSQIVPFIAR